MHFYKNLQMPHKVLLGQIFLKGASKLDKKQFTSWGVSFGSLALVAGMVSYLGLTNKNTTISNKPNQSQAASQSLDQQSPPIQNGDDQNSIGSSTNNDDHSTTDDHSSSSIIGDDQTTNDNGPSINFGDGSTGNTNQPALDNGSSAQNGNQGFGHHGRFDTTTGGS
jgi:hypothetical protein